MLETYDYDLFSNQLASVTEAGVTRSLTYSESGNTSQDDRGGGTVLAFTYDSTDRLVQVDEGTTTLASYIHNAMGQRVAKIVGGNTTQFLYNLSGLIIGEADGATGSTQTEYVWLNGMPLAFIFSGTIYTIHTDHLATPQRLTDGSGTVVWDGAYQPFGESGVSGFITFNLRFSGQYFDGETELHHNYYRDYNPSVGRYLQSDPVGLRSGWNHYAYVGGNPTMLVDPQGLTESILGLGESGSFGFSGRIDIDADEDVALGIQLTVGVIARLCCGENNKENWEVSGEVNIMFGAWDAEEGGRSRSTGRLGGVTLLEVPLSTTPAPRRLPECPSALFLPQVPGPTIAGNNGPFTWYTDGDKLNIGIDPFATGWSVGWNAVTIEVPVHLIPTNNCCRREW